MRIIRVFPRQTEMTPTDPLAFFDKPGLFIPEHEEVHVCCVFTWDKARAEELAYQWRGFTDKRVFIGGPAYDDPGTEFIPGRYIRQGVAITSRGCPNSCGFCFVPRREGVLRLLPVQPGNIIQDNNFLACPEWHKRKVYDMLRQQRAVSFRGGLEPGRITDWDIEEMRGLRLADVWLACDTKGAVDQLRRACQRLHAAGFSQNKIRCYVLIGDDMAENEDRLKTVFEAGALPFAQLFQPETPIEYSREWKQFARVWSRPAIYKTKFPKPEPPASAEPFVGD